MADEKISQTDEKTSIHATDLIPMVDIVAAPDKTKHITGDNLKKTIYAVTESELTIAGGAITATQLRHTVDTAGDAGTDDLDTINGGATIPLIILRAENGARTVIIKHNTGNIWLQGKVDIQLSNLEDGLMLAWDATNSKWFDIGAAGAGTLWTPKIYTAQIPWVCLDGCTTSIPGGGSIAIGAIAVLLGTGATITNHTLFRTTYGFNDAWPTGKECMVEFPLSYLSGTANHRILFLMTTSVLLPPTETDDHVGFILDGNDLYSSSADNTAQETQDTGINIASAGACLYQCKAVIDPGVSVKFYVDGVLKTTHTTRPPRADQAGGMVLTFGVETEANEDQKAAWERIIVTKEL